MFYTSQPTCALIVIWTAIVLLGRFSRSATDTHVSVLLLPHLISIFPSPFPMKSFHNQKRILFMLFTALCHPDPHYQLLNTSRTV
ncbi:hypothetical protein BC827DRAFT_1242092, partial [Russula dissimulans]